MVDYGSSIKKPFEDLKTFIIGMILASIPIVNILVEGYGLEVAKDTIKKKTKLREFKLDDIFDYIVNWVIMIVIGLVYLIIPIILIFMGGIIAVFNFVGKTNVAFGGDLSYSQARELFNSLILGGPFIIIGVILAVVALIFMPMAYMKYAKSGRIGSAFELRNVKDNVLTSDYIVTLIVLAVYNGLIGTIGFLVAMIFLFIPFIGFIIMYLILGGISFAITVTSMNAFAQTVE